MLTRSGPAARAGETVMVGLVALGAVSLVAVTVAAPAAIAVTVTVAPVDVLTEFAALRANLVGSLETQLTVRPDRLLPRPSFGVAVSNCVPPTAIVVDGVASVTEATAGSLTVMVGVVALGALSLVAVIVAVPSPAAVTVMVAPLEPLTELAAPTVKTAVLLELQLTVRPSRVLPFASLGIAVSS